MIVVVIAALIIGGVVWKLVGGGGSDHSKQVTRVGHPYGLWPLTVDTATLTCETGGKIVVSAGGTTYALNGLAREDSRYADLAPIWADDPQAPGLKISVGPLISEGQKLC